MRLACLYVPDFPLAALLRIRPDLRGTALAVVEGSGPRARLLAVSETAARHGVRCGITVAQARAIAAIQTESVSPQWLASAQAALCDAAESFSPRIEDAGGGIVYCDLAGLDSLHASEGHLARALSQRCSYLGLPPQIGVAGSKIAAWLAARDGAGITVIPPGEEWSFLAPVSVSLLQPDEALARTLQRWGIRTIGDLATLPAKAVGTRLGPEGVALLARARGEDARPLVPRLHALQFEESVDLDYGIEAIEPFLFVARPLLERLTARLAVRGLVCGDLRLSLRLSSGGLDDRTVVVSAPSNDVRSLLMLLRVHLESHPAGDAIERIRLTAVAEKLRAAQLDLFRPSGPAPAQLAVTLARLTAICGAEQIGAPATVDDHRPERYAVQPFAGAEVSRPRTRQGPQPGIGGERAESGLPVALRCFRPPQPIEVFCQRDRPEYVRGSELAGRVVQAAGPWRLHGHWWSAERYARDYYDAQLSDGGIYRIYCELPARRWFLDGAYD